MSKARGRKRRLDHAAVVKYARAHPAMYQTEIATHFHTTQSRVSHILRAAGIKGIYRGAPISRKHGQSEEEYRWEQVLHNAGLGMDRGIRLNKLRLYYGYDPAKEDLTDTSATSNPAL